jgi:hypothetical protein
VAITPPVLGAIHVLAAEGTKKVNNPILPTGNEFFWAAVTFVALWILMKFVLLPPMLKIMEERAAKRRDDLAAAEQASLQMADASAQYEASLSGARVDAIAKIEAAAGSRRGGRRRRPGRECSGGGRGQGGSARRAPGQPGRHRGWRSRGRGGAPHRSLRPGAGHRGLRQPC